MYDAIALFSPKEENVLEMETSKLQFYITGRLL